MKRYSFQAILVIFLLICSVDKVFSAEYGFPDPINLSCYVSVDSMGDQVGRDGANVYAVCSDTYSNIKLIKSIDGGQTFQPAVFVTTDGINYNPSMDVDKNGIIYIVYSKGASGSWFAKSVDKGVSFSQPVLFGSGTADVAVSDNGDIYVASGGYGGFSIFKSVDGGQTFNALNTPFINGGNPHTIAAKNGKLHIAWRGYGDGNLYYTWSEDGGATFAAVTNVSGSLGPITGQYGNRIISLTVDGSSNVHIAWSNAQNLYVSSKKYSDSNFVTKMIDTTGLNPVAPAMSNDLDGHLYLTWYQTASQGNSDTGTFFTRSDSTGETFLPAKRISGARSWTSIATNSEQDALVFADYFYKSIHCTADSCNLH